jgi:hypothetical protein
VLISEQVGDRFQQSFRPFPFGEKTVSKFQPLGFFASGRYDEDGDLWLQLLHLCGNFHARLVGKKMIRDDQVDRMLSEEIEPLLSRRGRQNGVAGAGQQKLTNSQRDLGIIDTENERPLGRVGCHFVDARLAQV